ncbi:MAG TPA: HAMP domain-containing sensor histidine kinase [Bryobacteraceae bacterium]|nr:HAMP domain-containing sensor histidine kinase [Bryobacteraceae bacterium]
MRLRLNSSMLSFGLTAVLLALLPLLALLQYRWIGQLSEAERERMQANVRVASANFAREFDGELTRAAMAFQLPPPLIDAKWDAFAQQHAGWLKGAPHRALVRAVYAVDAHGGSPRLLHSNPAAGHFEPVEWQPRFDALAETLRSHARDSAGERMGRGRPPLAWVAAEEIPALLLWLPELPFRGPPPEGRPREFRVVGCLVVELDLDYIRNQLLPTLTRRYFGDFYHVAVTSVRNPQNVIYTSHPEIPIPTFSPQDATAAIFALRPEEARETPPFLLPPSPGRERRPGLRRGGGWRGFPPTAGEWRVFVRHPTGSLESAVAAVRQRNLAISFGILLLLAATMATIVVSTRRAQNLARLQMEFVAGVSHDLLTPLAVIRSAADNLADGLVEGRQQVGKYGDLIRSESRGLSEMVRQTLDYASLQYQRRRYDFRPLDVREVIRQAAEACRSEVKESGIEIAEKIASDLPPVTGDAGALTMCLRNLLANAIKYGKDGGRIEIVAHTSAERHAGVEITVADRGQGIDPADLARIFEPFYRGRQAVASRTHGTGLGLSLVKHIIQDHGGTVTVKSVPGEGSAFTLHIPAARQVRA